MRVLVLQHVPFEGIGAMENWFEQHDASIDYVRFFEADATLPPAQDFDLIIAMGGPMSVNDEQGYPWLVAEKRFLREAIQQGETAVLGVCLGAQLIASALGARVYANPVAEIGWYPIHQQGTDEDCFIFPPQIEVLHWHGETFDLPEGAQLLASSAACAHQAFQLGDRVIGLQCHPEMTASIIADLLDECGDELVPGEWVQDAATLSGVSEARYIKAHQLMQAILEYLLME
ncbi:amidotransferase [Pokkaliibacter plantistimulans]|uniref:Amidotransferase n=1 Tax=Proteobacteria bacterium 228 TaxID=2083153 RepID=A0A2S5KVX4_9PROT|nr:amidotransferase [Pokkaliibacter plantistimulans]PPC78659.1 amidotransferase [Pokkaliibacter plantistimulans]